MMVFNNNGCDSNRDDVGWPMWGNWNGGKNVKRGFIDVCEFAWGHCYWWHRQNRVELQWFEVLVSKNKVDFGNCDAKLKRNRLLRCSVVLIDDELLLVLSQNASWWTNRKPPRTTFFARLPKDRTDLLPVFLSAGNQFFQTRVEVHLHETIFWFLTQQKFLKFWNVL